MLRRGLAVVVSGTLVCAGSAGADSSIPSPERIARLMAERGTIRRQLEEAFPWPGAEFAAAALGMSVEDTRETPGGLPHDRLGAAPARQAAPKPSRSFGRALLGLVVACVVACVVVVVLTFLLGPKIDF